MVDLDLPGGSRDGPVRPLVRAAAEAGPRPLRRAPRTGQRTAALTCRHIRSKTPAILRASGHGDPAPESEYRYCALKDPGVACGVAVTRRPCRRSAGGPP